MTNHLLPPNATASERAISETTARLSLDGDIGISCLWSAQDCPADLLPWLAWALAVDEWDSGWDEPVKRQVIAGSIERHRRAGTVWSVRQAMLDAGYPALEIVERIIGLHWAIFIMVLELGAAPLTRALKDKTIRLIDEYKPARCHLHSLSFRAGIVDEVSASEDGDMPIILRRHYLYNGACNYDGAIAYDGIIETTEIFI